MSAFITLLAVVALIGYVVGCKPSDQQQPPPASNAAAAHEHEHDREAAAQAAKFKEINSPADFKTVEEAAAGLKHPDPKAQTMAITRLQGYLEDRDPANADKAGKALVDLMRDQTAEEGNRGAATMALRSAADRYYGVLEGALGDKSEVVRFSALTALGGGTPGSPAEKKLLELTKSADSAVKATAVDALTFLRSKAGGAEIAKLVEQLGNPEGDASAKAAIEVKLKGAVALPYLERAIRNSPNPRQRHAATMCVACICAGKNPSQQRFAASVKAIRKGGAPIPDSDLRGLPILIYALKDTDPMTREIAAQGLGYLGDERAAGPLAAALSDSDTQVRRRAAAALVTTPAKTAQAALTRTATKDKDATVRRFAVEALGWIGDASAIGPLAAATFDKSAEVRQEAATQLGRLKSPDGLQALLELFKDPDEDVRWAAVQAVAEMRDKRATKALVVALDDPVAQVSNAAERGLQNLGIAKQRIPGMN
ncbi:HEAT repeat domain-containing protein [bacterium]|nr:HEAT repeat domain-containing protein [bacterium]